MVLAIDNIAKTVIPAKAGIQWLCGRLKFLDSRLCGNDELIENCEVSQHHHYCLNGGEGGYL
jgi:hypothetical protein